MENVKRAQVHQAVKNILHNELGFDRASIEQKMNEFLSQYLDHKFFGTKVENYLNSERFQTIVRSKLDAKMKQLGESAQTELHNEVVKIIKSKIKIKGINIEVL